MHLVAHRDPVLSGLLTVHERLTTVEFVKKKKKKKEVLGRARVNLRAHKYLGCFVMVVANWDGVHPVDVEPADGGGSSVAAGKVV